MPWFTTIRLFLGKVPKQLWIGLGVIALVLFGLWWHGRAVKKFGEEQFAAGVDHEQKRIAKKVERITVASEKVSIHAKKIFDNSRNLIGQRAVTFVMRGPGKAACSPIVSQSSSGSGPAISPGDSAVSGVPSGPGIPLIGVPIDAASAIGQHCDTSRAENKAWRDWYKEISEIWGKTK